MPTSPGWEWDAKSRRYREKATGHYLSHGQMVVLRDRFTDARRDATKAFVAGALPESAAADAVGWNVGVRYLREAGWQNAERNMIAQYVFGRGGRNAMTPEDRVQLQGMLREQKQYWDGFMREALEGKLSRDGVASRAAMYDHAGTTFYEQGRAGAFAMELPAYPGQGTRCLSNCRCSWQIVERKERIEATWQTSPDPCPDCLERSRRWAPFVWYGVTEEGAAVEAERLYAKASAAEPAVTRDLRTLEEGVDGSLNKPFQLASGQTVHPLDARLKTVESTKRKVLADANGKGISVKEAAGGIKDNLRYTYILDEGKYGKDVAHVVNGLEEMGYERVMVKNFWEKEGGYTGVHGIFRTEEGQYFEVQFHTDRTIQTKEQISHPLYEKQRVLPADSPEWQGYQDQIDGAWRVVRDDPPDLAGIP